jgi:hypothetical protein
MENQDQIQKKKGGSVESKTAKSATALPMALGSLASKARTLRLFLGFLIRCNTTILFYFLCKKTQGVLHNEKSARKKNHRARVLGEFDVVLNAGGGEPLVQPGQLLGRPTRPLLLSLRALLRVVQHFRLHPAK